MQSDLLNLLADGKFHSGEMLASSLNVSRTAIWKMIPHIKEFGLELHSVKGKGYRLVEALNLLNEEQLTGHMSSGLRSRIKEVKIFSSIPSTSTYVMELARSGELDLSNKKVFVCLAEQQTSGRGRRGRTWVSPFGHNIYLTLAREFANGISELEGLSLVVGLAVIKVLQRNGFEELGIKWPNDILWRGRKLAGILLEVSGDPTGLTQVMVGLGLNIKSNTQAMAEVEQDWVDLNALSTELPERNKLSAELLDEIIGSIDVFEQKGFTVFRNDWDKLDALKNQDVELRTNANQSGGVQGKVLGVNEQGALILQTESGVQTFHGGELSPRVLTDPRQ